MSHFNLLFTFITIQTPKDARLVPGGGAVEMEMSRQVESFSETCEGLEQYAVKRFANALQVVPKILAENTGICKIYCNINEIGSRGVLRIFILVYQH